VAVSKLGYDEAACLNDDDAEHDSITLITQPPHGFGIWGFGPQS